MATKPFPTDCGTAGASAVVELLPSYTCVDCGRRSASWAAYRAHRAACSGRLQSRPARPERSVALAALAEVVRAEAAGPEPPQPEAEPPQPETEPEPEPEPGALAPERDPFLDAPPEALRALERSLERAQDEGALVALEVAVPGPLADDPDRGGLALL